VRSATKTQLIMKLAKTKTNKILEGDLTPMIDMTFQLIDRAEEITLPVSELAVPPEGRPDYQVILNLEPGGNVIFEGQRIPKIDVMGPILKQEIRNADREDVSKGEIAIIIRSHEDTPTGLVQKLIAKCQDEELENFVLRVNEKIN